MICPRCEFDQPDGEPECVRCGVIFAKLRQRSQESPAGSDPKAESASPEKRSPRRGMRQLGTVLASLGVVVAGAAWGARGAWLPFDGGSASHSDLDSVADPESAETSAASEPVAQASGLEGELQRALRPTSMLEQARMATVSIEASWGTGSGYFASADCRIVTNRHVVDAEKKIREVREARAALEQDISRVKQQYTFVTDHIDKVNSSRTRYVVGQGLLERQREQYDQLQGLRGQHLELTAQLEKLESTRSLFRVTTADGSVFETEAAHFSSDYDLAFLVLDEDPCPYLAPADGRAAIGARVFAIGSPMGLQHSVTAGIVSGYRQDDEIVQTDVPINPGNSGGPLIDESGHVVGVNTARIRASDGLGFAISTAVVAHELARVPSSLGSVTAESEPAAGNAPRARDTGESLLLPGPYREKRVQTSRKEDQRKMSSLYNVLSSMSSMMVVVGEFRAEYGRMPKNLQQVGVSAESYQTYGIESLWMGSQGSIVAELDPDTFGEGKRVLAIPDRDPAASITDYRCYTNFSAFALVHLGPTSCVSRGILAPPQ